MGDREKAREAHCNEYDTEPVNLEMLRENINELLGAS